MKLSALNKFYVYVSNPEKKGVVRFLQGGVFTVCVIAMLGCGNKDPAGTEQSSAVVESSFQATPPIDENGVTRFIVVDQFGYLPHSQKVAVIRDPQQGFDAQESFTPGSQYQLVNKTSAEVVYSGIPVAWNAGAVDALSGDKVWWFDFSEVTQPGVYELVDVKNNVRSPPIRIGDDVYKDVLKHAVRTFYYQRAGFAKKAPFADPAWEDDASHIGPGQDKNARLFNGDATTERDLSGGWYDAGDYNKYTNWHANYLITLLHTYLEAPEVWTDDFGIPESGNGIPDLLDEIKWGLDWLVKMQEPNGSVLSVMGLSHASPPSAAKGPSVYGPASTSATLSSAAAYAFAGKVFLSLSEQGVISEHLKAYAEDLKMRAQKAWIWAEAHPDVTFYNQPNGVAAGEQEVDDNGRRSKKLTAAIYLFAATHSIEFRNYVDAHSKPVVWVDPWSERRLTHALYYASLKNASKALASEIKQGYAKAMARGMNLPAVRSKLDPYNAFLGKETFTWGSNRSMSQKGSAFYHLITHHIGGVNLAEVRNAALGYVHYLHGVNPLGIVYLSNMYSAGAHYSVNEFYHSWFFDGSKLWDRVGQSTYGPAPGFLVGGPNPFYDWDKVCASKQPNKKCGEAPLAPPKGQPVLKSYLDFNTSWPINSWQVTENHNDYQVAYIRLLSKFVP